MSEQDPRVSAPRPAVHLLDELESIKGVLTDGRAANANPVTDIPLLDDMVIDHLDENAALLGNNKLLDIERIFNDAMHEVPAAGAWLDMQFPRFTLDVDISDDNEIATAIPSTAPASAPPISTPPVSTLPPARVRPAYSRETLIQELVDAFVPQIEAELHKRLRQLDDAALRKLKDSE